MDIDEKYKNIPYITNDQKEACKEFFDFYDTSEQKTFGLYGFSGTGKTTIITEIVSSLLKNKIIKSVVFSAPTNKAVNVIKNKFEKSVRDILHIYYEEKNQDLLFDDIIYKLTDYDIKIDFMTIHKLLNCDVDFDIDGKIIFKKTQESDIWKYNLVVIDECSMIPALMIDTIFSDIRGDMRKLKIVFSGDTAQLPPVNEKNSIIFSQKKEDYPMKSYFENFDIDKEDIVRTTCFKTKYDLLMQEIINMKHFVMKDVVRSKSNKVLGVCTTIRNWTLGNIEKFQIGKFIEKNGDCTAFRNNKSVRKINSEWFKKFVEYCNDKKDTIIITWTNKQCDEYNNEIRKELFKKTLLDKFCVGDVLMLGDFYNMPSKNADDDNKFYTSEQIEVLQAEIIEKDIGIFSKNLPKQALKLENSDNYNAFYQKTIEKIYQTVKKKYKCWKLHVKRLTSNKYSIIYVVHEEYEKVCEAEKEFVSNCILRLRNKLMSKYKEKTSVIDNNIIKHLWKLFHSIYIQPFATVNYGYCITCHKAQGSTFYNVFVDLDDITKNTNENEMKRCLYTAVSRTSNELCLLV